MDLDGTYLIT